MIVRGCFIAMLRRSHCVSAVLLLRRKPTQCGYSAGSVVAGDVCCQEAAKPIIYGRDEAREADIRDSEGLAWSNARPRSSGWRLEPDQTRHCNASGID
jgi:hypothetical protein